jgi:3-carboxy-cis,cis-muconate cycloisomerase
VLARATAEAERTGAPLAAVLAAVPEVELTEAELARVLDPLRYLGAAGHLVDRALASHSPG